MSKLADVLAQIPELSAPAREMLVALADGGATVNPYQSMGRWNIEIRTAGQPPDLEPRWSPRAWSAYVDGWHLSEDPECQCMCRPCQEARWAKAAERMRLVDTIAKGEAMLAKRDMKPGAQEALAAIVESLRKELARLDAPRVGGAA